MGYESRIYIARNYGSSKGCEIIATLNLCCLGHSPEAQKFKALFDTPIPFKVCVYERGENEEGTHYVSTDCYGKPLKYGNIKALRNQTDKMIEECIANREYSNSKAYWRLYLLRDMLESFRDFAEQQNLYVIHYGY